MHLSRDINKHTEHLYQGKEEKKKTRMSQSDRLTRGIFIDVLTNFNKNRNKLE